MLQGQAKRNFVQTFFLAVQERGYFVLNDLFRYLADVQPTPGKAENGFAPASVAERPPAQVGLAACPKML